MYLRLPILATTQVLVLCMLVSCGGGGGGTSASSPTPLSDLVADCTGANCAIASANTYSGTGTAVWRIDNTTSATGTINVGIGGVTAGNQVTMVFSNGSTGTASTVPSAGVLANAGPVPLATHITSKPHATHEHPQDASHHQISQLNADVVADVLRRHRESPSRPAGLGALDAAKVSGVVGLNPTPAVNDTRSWRETGFNSGTYSTTAKAVCPVHTTGRSVVIWSDASSISSGKVTNASITALSSMFCGASGGYEKLVALIGDAWGSVPAGVSSSYISDAGGKQDINIVILDALTSTWAGYFYGVNNYLTSVNANSNQALVFFLRASSIATDLRFMQSSLVHEATHMVNFYQRSIAQGVSHDTWLEETSAMMSEDIITPTLVKNANNTDYNNITSYRLPLYAVSGAAHSLTNWASLNSTSYAMGGAFGAFINRRYGVPLYKQLITCGTGATGSSSYACMDYLIKTNGGTGFANDFSKLGVTVFSQLGTANLPTGYGFPAKTGGGYTLAAADVANAVAAAGYATPSNGTAVTSFSGVMHGYKKDTIAAGKTTFARTGVVVPGNTSLVVMVK